MMKPFKAGPGAAGTAAVSLRRRTWNTREPYIFHRPVWGGEDDRGQPVLPAAQNTKPNAVYLDGDEIRVAFGEDVGYTNDDRLRWAGRIFRVCRLLSDQGIDVVCCSIAMFDTVRRWNREHIPNYKEIYIRVKKRPSSSATRRASIPGAQCGGVDLPFDEPQSPDLVLQNDGERTPLELVEGSKGALPEHRGAPHRQYRLLEPVLSKQALSHQPLPLRPVCVHPGGAGADAGGAGVRQRAGRPLLCLSGAGRGGDGPLRRPSACSGSSRSHTPGSYAATSSATPSTSRRAMTTPTAALPSTPSTRSRSGCSWGAWPGPQAGRKVLHRGAQRP